MSIIFLSKSLLLLGLEILLGSAYWFQILLLPFFLEVPCYSPPDSSVHGILQARILEWVAMPFSRGSSRLHGSSPGLLCHLHWQMSSAPLVPPGKPIVIVNWLPNHNCSLLKFNLFHHHGLQHPWHNSWWFLMRYRWYFQYDQPVPLLPFFQCIVKYRELIILSKIFWFKTYLHHDVVVCPWAGYLIWYVIYLIKLLHLIEMFHSFPSKPLKPVIIFCCH